MSSSPKISVLLPVYNCEGYLALCVRSILDQSMMDFEFFLFDDGSSDGSLDIMRKFASEDSRIVVKSRENQGIVRTLNEMLQMASGQYIARMDADDIAHPERFEEQVQFLDDRPDVVLCGSGVVVIDEEGMPIYRAGRPEAHEDIERALLDGRCVITHPTVMARRECMLQVQGYREEYRDVEDLDLFLRLADVGKLANLSSCLLSYRVHQGSISTVRHLHQLELAMKAASEARLHRGIDSEVPQLNVSGDRSPVLSRGDQCLVRAWQAWNAGYEKTWKRYALRAVKHKPWSAKAWKVLLIRLWKRPVVEAK